VILNVCTPASTPIEDGVVPTKVPSISMSAPDGSDEISAVASPVELLLSFFAPGGGASSSLALTIVAVEGWTDTASIFAAGVVGRDVANGASWSLVIATKADLSILPRAFMFDKAEPMLYPAVLDASPPVLLLYKVCVRASTGLTDVGDFADY